MFRIAAGLEFDGTSALRKLIVAYTQLGEIAQALEIDDDSAMQQALVEVLAQLVEAGLVVHR